MPSGDAAAQQGTTACAALAVGAREAPSILVLTTVLVGLATGEVAVEDPPIASEAATGEAADEDAPVASEAAVEAGLEVVVKAVASDIWGDMAVGAALEVAVAATDGIGVALVAVGALPQSTSISEPTHATHSEKCAVGMQGRSGGTCQLRVVPAPVAVPSAAAPLPVIAASASCSCAGGERQRRLRRTTA